MIYFILYRRVGILTEEFHLEYGAGIASRFLSEHPEALIITQEEIWTNLKDLFPGFNGPLYYLDSLETEILDSLAEKEKNRRLVVGLGGGRAADIAKFLNWNNGTSLVQIPSIISVDAFFTHEIAIRDQGVVKYTGDAVPEKVLIDTDLLQRAPALLNRSGLGDILSCHTGLFDWKLAADAGFDPAWDGGLAKETEELLQRVYTGLDEIQGVSPAGIRLLTDSLNWIGHRCWVYKHPRFEEGSEHHFVYNLEYITGKHFVHGQAVCLGCCIMSLLQDNNSEKMFNAVHRAGVPIRAEDLDITWSDIEKTLLTLNSFVKREKLPYTIIHEKNLDQNFVELVRGRFNF